MDKRLEELQRQYFDFCTGLIKSISPENCDQDLLMTKAFNLQHELEKEIIRNQINHKIRSLQEVEEEIGLLKTCLAKK
jgi:hypothetical protein